MAGSNTDRSDTIRMLREQASRVYLQTIAANEREDRILNKKLDALDLEHRAQFLKMKKWIQDAHSYRKKRLSKMASSSRYYSGRITEDTQATTQSCRAKKILQRERAALPKTDILSGSNEEMFPKTDLLPGKIDNKVTKKFIDEDPLIQFDRSKRRRSSMLKDRVKYTESEVAHLKASFAGQKTPPNLRRRRFLPHLQANAAAPILGLAKRKNRGSKKKSKVTENEGTLEEKFKGLNVKEEAANRKLPQISIQHIKTPVTT